MQLVSCRRQPAEDLDSLLLDALQRRLGVVARLTGARDLPACASEIAAPAVTCGTHDDLPAQELRRIAAGLQRSLRLDASSTALRREALWSLLQRSDRRNRQRAAVQLTLALDLEPTSPARQNDLAAVLLLRGALDNRPADWVEALDLADRAAERGLLEARFNRALALELLTLARPARDDWTTLSRLAGQPRLAMLARDMLAHQRQFDRRDAPLSPSSDALPLRRRGEKLVGAWAVDRLAGRARAATARLDEGATVASQHALVTGDPTLTDAVETIRLAVARDPLRAASLARGHAAYEAARGEQLYAACGDHLDAATRELARGATPFAGWAYVDQAVCAYYRRDFATAMARLESTLRLATEKPRPALTGRARWIIGLIRTLEGKFAAAERQLQSAASDLAAGREPSHVVYLQTLRAKALESGGQPDQAWERRMVGLSGRSQVPLQRTLSILEEAVQSVRARGLERAAYHFLAEQAATAEAGAADSAAEADFLAYVLLQRAALLRELQAKTRARQDLARVEGILRRLPATASTRRRLDLELAVERALLTGYAPTATAELTAAIAFFRGAGPEADQLETLRLLRLRARVQHDAGDFAAAEADLRAALVELERQRGGLEANDQRARFEAQASGTETDLVDLLVERGRVGDALEIVEQSGNRWWLDSGRVTRRIPAALAPSMVADDTLVLRYDHAPHRLLIWAVSRDGIALTRVPVSHRRLDRLARMCRERDLPSRRRQRPFCDALAGYLLPPAVVAVPRGGRLLVVADSLSQDVPYAALRLPPPNEYLVERLRVALVPSVLHLADIAPARPLPTRAVFVADPATRGYPGLPPLSGAREAARAYAATYSDPLVLAGSDATRAAVVRAFDGAEVAHFDAHGYAVPGEPDVSGVVLAADTTVDDDGLLKPGDLGSARWPGLRLGVLAGCRTSPQPYEGTAQLSGLATALLAAGAEEVVTAAWDIENETAIRLFTAFHACYARGSTGDTCLLEAQLSLLGSGDPVLAQPRSWAGYQLYSTRWNSGSAVRLSRQGADR
jgi:hypothetical protein